MKKRFLNLLFTSFILAACGPSKDMYSVFIYDTSDPFMMELESSIEEYMKCDIKVYNGNKSQITQNEQINDAISKNEKILLLNLVDRLSAGTIINKAKKKNTPIIFFNREPLLSDLNNYDKAFYVGLNPSRQGELQVEAIKPLFGDPNDLNSKFDKNNDDIIQILILKGEQGHQDAEKRTDAVISSLIQSGYNIEVLGIEVANWNRNEAYKVMKQIYPNIKDKLELVFSNNDEMALGCYDFLSTQEDFTLENIIPILGVDRTLAGKKAVDDGHMYATVVNDSTLQACAITELTDILINNKDISTLSFTLYENKCIYIDSTLYFKENS